MSDTVDRIDTIHVCVDPTPGPTHYVCTSLDDERCHLSGRPVDHKVGYTSPDGQYLWSGDAACDVHLLAVIAQVRAAADARWADQ